MKAINTTLEHPPVRIITGYHKPSFVAWNFKTGARTIFVGKDEPNVESAIRRGMQRLKEIEKSEEGGAGS